jgi:CubicO group peptidase (beta-lactamase class C family)
MAMRPRFAFAVFLALPLALAAQSPDASRIERMLRPRVRVVNEPDTAFNIVDRMRQYHIPGLSLAVIDGNRIVFARGYGVEEFGGTRAIDTTTLFQAGSISKPVFASGLMALVQQGKLDLDADVNRYLTSWKMPSSRFTEQKPITLRRLMTHTAGLTVWGFPGYGVGKPVATVQQVLDGSPPANTPAVRNDTFPDAMWRYSGGGITIAQLVTTDVTGEPFPALMHRLVMRPAGMTRSTYEQMLPASVRSAAGHERMDTPVPGRAHIYPEMAAAGLWTTAPELARWAIALTKAYRGESSEFLSQAMAKAMVSRQVEVQAPYRSALSPAWGIGVSVGGDHEAFHFSHGGRDEGFIASLFMWPTSGRGIAIMANGVNGAIFDEINRAFGEIYGIENGVRIERRSAQVEAASLDALVGAYKGTAPNGATQIIDVTRGGNRLILAARNGQVVRTVTPGENDTFFDRESPFTVTFERDANTRGKSLSFVQGPTMMTLIREP